MTDLGTPSQAESSALSKGEEKSESRRKDPSPSFNNKANESSARLLLLGGNLDGFDSNDNLRAAAQVGVSPKTSQERQLQSYIISKRSLEDSSKGLRDLITDREGQTSQWMELQSNRKGELPARFGLPGSGLWPSGFTSPKSVRGIVGGGGASKSIYHSSEIPREQRLFNENEQGPAESRAVVGVSSFASKAKRLGGSHRKLDAPP